MERESAPAHYRLPWTELAGRVETLRGLLIDVKGGAWLLIPTWPWSADELSRLRAHVPDAAPAPRFDFVRFGIGFSMVLVSCSLMLGVCW